jgi:hypothetical protein
VSKNDKKTLIMKRRSNLYYKVDPSKINLTIKIIKKFSWQYASEIKGPLNRLRGEGFTISPVF